MIPKNALLLWAGGVWLIAGGNVLKIGLTTYEDHQHLLNYSLSLFVFCCFWFLIFSKMTKKHTQRIQNYKEDRQFFLKFFDLKSFLIMVFMMTLGIVLRVFQLAPERFIAVFYTGLGTALSLAGLFFGWNYYKIKSLETSK